MDNTSTLNFPDQKVNIHRHTVNQIKPPDVVVYKGVA